MSPECWKRKYGNPHAASDIFSFGLMMWEMIARRRIYNALDDLKMGNGHGHSG
eukprot:COSAG02_NODE_57078_length_282_cov_0.836066_2_plen_53_part_01